MTEKKKDPTPPAPPSVTQTPAPVAVTECSKCHIRHSVNEACPGCGRRVLLG
jgi:hypothetical protein